MLIARSILFGFSFLCLFMAPTGAGAQGQVPPQRQDSLAFQPADSAKAKAPADTLKVSPDAIQDPVKYAASDSIVFEVDSQRVLLFNKGKVDYGDINLESGFIRMDMKTNLVNAGPIPDSTGKPSQLPKFTDGGSEFNASKMTYNIKTKKGKIWEVDTKEGEGYLHGEAVKKDSTDVVYMRHGTYTTCNLKHPHYYFSLSRLKVIPDDKIITGPAHLVVGDVPTPLAFPFGFFPNRKGRASGILVPQYGEAANIGFFLKDGGYYWGINDYVDMMVQGDIYTRGSWAVRAGTQYVNRYRYSGAFNANFANIKIGEEGFPNYQLNRDFFVRWRHNQDQKAHPGRRFSADVNVGTRNYNSLNSQNTTDLLSNTFQSSVRYDYSWANLPINLSVTARHSQNTINRTFDLSLPETNFGVNRFFLFKRGGGGANGKWWENVTLAYNNKIQNTVNTFDSLFFNNQVDWNRSLRTGMNHNVPLTTSIRVLKHFTFTPTINYTESWYLSSIRKRWNQDDNSLVIDTLRGFDAARDVVMSGQMRTVVYGTYLFRGGPVKGLRHMLIPSLSLNYNPAIGKSYLLEANGNIPAQRYSPFEGSLFGAPTVNKRADIVFSLVNSLEMKVKSAKDTISGTTKVKIFENISIDGNYNAMADSMNWSPLSFNARSQPLPFLSFNFISQLNPYALNATTGIAENRYQYDVNRQPFRLTNANLAITLTMRSKNAAPITTSENAGRDELEMVNNNRDAYVDFNVPWTLNVSYNFLYSRPGFTSNLTQAVSFSGDVNVTNKWKVGFNSGYDVIAKQFTFTSMNIYRDLHCWEMRFNFVPFGLRKSYSLDINVKASVLQDLKLSRKRNWFDLQ